MAINDFSENLEQTQESAEKPHHFTMTDLREVQGLATQLADKLANIPDGDLLGEMVLNTMKLLRDRTNRGDLKLLNKSIKELRYALKIFAPYREVRKVSIFGSARTLADHPDYLQTAEFSRRMVQCGWMIITGAGGGIMAAGHGGAGAEPSFGLAIRLPFEQHTNEFIANDPKLINFKYFFTRKLMFVRAANAIALCPGGFGTMDEGFEVLTLIQTGKSTPIPIVLLDSPGGTYWKAWEHYVHEALLRKGFIGEEDLDLFKITDNVDVAVREVTHFYRNYHSIRYHRDELIIRLAQKPTETQLAQLERDFADIKTTGHYHVSGALPVEHDEPTLNHLHRLTFAFNKHDQGRLRKLIDRLNDMAD